MSRIGNQPITLPRNIDVTLGKDNTVSIKGPNGTLAQQLHPTIQATLTGNTLTIRRTTDQKNTKALHGLYRVLLHNNIIGVTTGFKKTLQLVGIGYKAEAENNVLQLQLGKSHATYILMPHQINVKVEMTKGKKPTTYIHIEGIDKQLVGQVAAKIRDQKPPEPFITKRSNTQKGIRYIDERLIGKTKKDGK